MFLENLKTIGVQVVILYAIAAVGFVADKRRIYTQDVAKKTTDLLFNIVLPMAVISTFMKMERTPERIKGLFIALACAVVTHLLGIVLGALTFRKKDVMERGIYRYAIVFSNAAFLALPLAQTVVGDEGVFYCSVYVGVFNAFAFTFGVHVISGKKAKINAKSVLFNPGTVSIVIGVILFLLQIKLPGIIAKPMEMIGSLNSPLAMLVFGTFLANANLKKLFLKKEFYLVSLLRLVVIPLIMLLVYKFVGLAGNIAVSLVISASAPTATNTAMYAGRYENDSALASQLAAQSTVLSVVSMPVIVALAGMM